MIESTSGNKLYRIWIECASNKFGLMIGKQDKIENFTGDNFVQNFLIFPIQIFSQTLNYYSLQ